MIDRKPYALFLYLASFVMLTGITGTCNSMLPKKKPNLCIAINCEQDWVVHLKIWGDLQLFYCAEHMKLFEEFCPNKFCKIIEDKRKKSKA